MSTSDDFFGKSLILDRKNPIFCTKIRIFSKKSTRSGYGSEIFLVLLNDSCHVPLSYEPRYSSQTYVLESDDFFENGDPSAPKSAIFCENFFFKKITKLKKPKKNSFK